MRVLLVLLMVFGTSSIFAKKRSHNKKTVEVTREHSQKRRGYQRGYERGYNRSDRKWRRHNWRDKRRYGRRYKNYYKRPVKVVRYERQPRYVYWPRFSVVLDL